MEPVKPLCDLCVRSGVFNSIMLSYQALDDVFDTQLGIPYHCNSGSHERAYHGAEDRTGGSGPGLRSILGCSSRNRPIVRARIPAPLVRNMDSARSPRYATQQPR